MDRDKKLAATDLTGVLEKLDWADEQITDLNVSISDYLAREPYALRPQPAPNGRGQVYYFEATELVPPGALHCGRSRCQ